MSKNEKRVPRILVVEDEPVVNALCRRVLAAMGARVDTAANGKIAREALAKQCYDLLLVDIRMPDMDGKELYTWLKEKHPEMADRVIFATGELITGDIEGFLRQTGRPFLTKPFGRGELEATVRQALLTEGDKCPKK